MVLHQILVIVLCINSRKKCLVVERTTFCYLGCSINLQTTRCAASMANTMFGPELDVGIIIFWPDPTRATWSDPTRSDPKLTWNSGPDPTRPILHDIQLSNIRHHDDHMMTIWHKKRPNNLNANNKNLAIANRSRVGCAHNTLRASKTWICIAHRCIQPLVRCRFPYFGADLRLTSPSARHQLTLRDHGPQLVYHATCLFTPQLSPVLIAPAHGGVVQAELTWVAGSAR